MIVCNDMGLHEKIERIVELHKVRKSFLYDLEQVRLSIDCCLRAEKERKEIELSFFVELGNNMQSFFSLDADFLKDVLSARSADIIKKINNIDELLRQLSC